MRWVNYLPIKIHGSRYFWVCAVWCKSKKKYRPSEQLHLHILAFPFSQFTMFLICWNLCTSLQWWHVNLLRLPLSKHVVLPVTCWDRGRFLCLIVSPKALETTRCHMGERRLREPPAKMLQKIYSALQVELHVHYQVLTEQAESVGNMKERGASPPLSVAPPRYLLLKWTL